MRTDIETRTPPPLPVVQSETALAIFIHSSLRSSVQNDRFGDAERLAFLGQKALHMVIAETLFEKRPMMTAVELITELENTLSDESYEQWVSYYKLREKVACPADLRGELREARQTQHLFDAYVGAVYIEQGYSSIKTWIQPLVDPNSASGSSMGVSTGNPPPPMVPPPPLPNNGSVSGQFLALFNQTAIQRGVKIQWVEVQSGPGHALTWKADCIVDGIMKGSGAGKSKQQAKEEAARQAYQAMGWARGASGQYR